MKPTLLILAAGMGSRYGGLKQMDAVGTRGETIIEYSIFDAIEAGFGKVVFVIRKDFEKAFRAQFEPKLAGRIAVDYAFQEINSPIEGIEKLPNRPKPWGTGHAILIAEKVVNEPFTVINADDYYGRSGYEMMANFLANRCNPSHYAMVGYRLKNTLSDFGSVSRGLCQIDEQHYLTDVVERGNVRRNGKGVFCDDENGTKILLGEDNWVSMNIWGFHPNIFQHLKRQFRDFVEANYLNPQAEFYIPFAVNDLVKEGKIKLSVLPNHEKWYGVTYREDRPVVQEAFAGMTAAGKYPTPLWQ